jgi:cell wall-associated NlpC family hydrolase
MPASKHVGRLIVCLLVLCLLFCLTPGQALAEDDQSQAPTGQIVTLVRRSAYAGTTVIGCFEDGTRLKVLGTKNQFYRVDCYDMTGYIMKSQVRQDENGEYYVNCVAGSSETKTLPTRTPEDALALRGDVRTEALKYQGVPYVWGGTTPRGFDCSGFVQYVFKSHGIALPRTSKEQYGIGTYVSKSNLKAGDLVFFNTEGNGVSHLGIYIGNNQFIHASTSKGVIITSLSNTYWSPKYYGAKRIL